MLAFGVGDRPFPRVSIVLFGRALEVLSPCARSVTFYRLFHDTRSPSFSGGLDVRSCPRRGLHVMEPRIRSTSQGKILQVKAYTVWNHAYMEMDTNIKPEHQ
jgi:hypothetical protein